jgi:hypothetical protein
VNEEAVTLGLTVALSPPLAALVEAAPAPVGARIETEVAEVLGDLGVAGRPTVELVPDVTVTHGPIALFVGGQRCRFAETTIAEALAYLDGTLPVAVGPVAMLERLRRSEPARAGEMLASVCRAAISAQPEILASTTDDPARRAALSLGMSVAGSREEAKPAFSAGVDRGEDWDPVERFLAAAAGETIDLHIDPGYLRFLTSEWSREDMFPFLRDSLFVELGLPLPPFHFRPDASLRPGAFAFRINALRTPPRIGLPGGAILVNDTPERLKLMNVDAQPALNPATDQPASVVGDEHKESLEAAGLTTWTPSGFLILCLAAAVRRRAHALMTCDVAERLAQELDMAFTFLAAAARTHLGPDRLADVLRELLRDGISIRNLRRIVELMLRYETSGANGRQDDLVGFVRSGLADLIAHKVSRGTGTVVVYLLDPELEQALADRADERAPTGAEDPLPERLSLGVRAELEYLPRTAWVPALLTRDDARRPLAELLRHEFPQTTVVSYGDLPPECNVQAVARISAS